MSSGAAQTCGMSRDSALHGRCLCWGEKKGREGGVSALGRVSHSLSAQPGLYQRLGGAVAQCQLLVCSQGVSECPLLA